MKEIEAKIAVLEAKNKAQDEMIGHLQCAFDNSVKQKLDGFKYNLAYMLESTVKAARDDYSEFSLEEQLEVYKALLGDMIGTLEHYGVVIE